MIYVYDNLANISSQMCKMLYGLLPPTQKRKADARQGASKTIAIMEYFALKNILNFSNLPDFEFNANGKPMLKNFKFSISHANNILCIAVLSNSDKTLFKNAKISNIGVDIAKINEFDEKLCRYIATPNEYKKIKALKNKSLALAKLFAKKEAAIKCLGLTIASIKNVLQTPNLYFKFKKFKSYIICECFN